MATPNLVYGVACAAAFGAGAWLVHRLWMKRPLDGFSARLVAGASVGVGLAAGLAG